MFRFLRRVFIILVLLIIIFVIFRIAKPEATSRFVDKVKSVPTTISSRFHREKDPELIINGKSNKNTEDTDFSAGNNIDQPINNYNENTEDEKDTEKNEAEENVDKDINDLTRLKEINQEIESLIEESILSGDNQEEQTVNETNNEANVTEDDKQYIGDVEQPEKKSNTTLGDVEQPETKSQTQTNTTQTSTNPSKILTQEQRGNCAKAGLSVKDCEDLVRDLSNYN